MKNNHVKHAIHNTLSSLYVTEQVASDLLAQAKGGRKVKTKLSVAMVLTIVLIVLAATAIAITLLWENHVIDVKKKEISEGEYSAWEIKSKRDLVKSLVEMGHIQESEQTRELFNQSTEPQKQEEIADNLMLALTGQTDAREINADIITYAIFGPESTWTPAQRVWWQQVTNMFRNADDDLDSFVLAEQEDLPEEMAVSIAKDAIEKAYGLQNNALDNAKPVANLYVTKERPDYRRWDVQFQDYKEGTSNYIQKVYTAVVDMKGNVISDADVGIEHPEVTAEKRRNPEFGRPTNEIFQAIDKFNERANFKPFKTWSLELKAEYSQVVAPQVRAIVESGDLSSLINGDSPDLFVIASSAFTYGIPGEHDMKLDDALSLAKQALLKTNGLSHETLSMYNDTAIYFDITNPEIPVWKFLFWPGFDSEEHFLKGSNPAQAKLRYKVEIESRTGEIVKAEEFQFQPLGKDLDFMLKLH